ncbi:glucose-6-phosphate dehydrogenase assembly protein OpcA [Corynebacterium freiburgense]|uniref:glucose-6-phosphate dehydrogenase assembly protein OpcA n=1 Tax=Corynebacterium freiburgense TaxID=556548 RepID=UPI0003FD6407|nr:glucose-6-phosphate dehydrogenase assembly protein OpcA [Corynebacterium freiburgense]WJZ02715.1 Glucose-6-phosphate dehydrogenase subunit [Corynebacterium freiburgense]
MIFDLPNTNTRDIAKQLVSIRETGTQVATGRVLTLIAVAHTDDPIEPLIETIAEATREHPSRVLLLIAGDLNANPQLDAQIRMGGDAGAAEIIIIRLQGEVANHMEAVATPLLLPDTPIVAWWPAVAPVNPTLDRIGGIAQRRITDAQYDPPVDSIYRRRTQYHPGDSDLSWSRITPWRGIVAATLDQPPHEKIIDATVYGPADSPSVDLAAGWLADRLGITVLRETTEDCQSVETKECIPVSRIELNREDSTISIEVRDTHTLAVQIPGRAEALVALGKRSTADCLAEELRHLDADKAYEKALRGLSHVRYGNR